MHRLIEQMLGAKRQCPSVPAVGLIYLACLSSDPLKKKAKSDKVGSRVPVETLCAKVMQAVEAELKAVPYTWLEPLRILTPILGVKTTFDFPSVHVWFGMGAVAI